MVYIDPERQRLISAVRNAKDAVEEETWNLWLYDNGQKLYEHKLRDGRTYAFGTNDRVLLSESPLEKCPFDNRKLTIIFPIIGEQV